MTAIAADESKQQQKAPSIASDASKPAGKQLATRYDRSRQGDRCGQVRHGIKATR